MLLPIGVKYFVLNPLVNSVHYKGHLTKIFNFNFGKDPQKKFPMSVATMSR